MMYTRNFSREDEGISIPQNYDGTSLLYDGAQREEKSEECPKIEENKEYTPSWLDTVQARHHQSNGTQMVRQKIDPRSIPRCCWRSFPIWR